MKLIDFDDYFFCFFVTPTNLLLLLLLSLSTRNIYVWVFFLPIYAGGNCVVQPG